MTDEDFNILKQTQDQTSALKQRVMGIEELVMEEYRTLLNLDTSAKGRSKNTVSGIGNQISQDMSKKNMSKSSVAAWLKRMKEAQDLQLVTAFRYEVSFLSWKHLLRRLWQLTLIGLQNNDTAKNIFFPNTLSTSEFQIAESLALLWYSTTYFIYLTFTFASCFDESSFQPSLSLSLLVNILGHFTFISATLRSTHLLPSISTNNILSSFHRCLFWQHVQVFPSFSASSRNPLLHPNLAMTRFYALLHPWLLLPLILPSLSSIHRHLLFY